MGRMVDLKALRDMPWSKLVVIACIAIVPAVLSYCKASEETDVAQREADAGYKALVDSVKHLELVVRAQQETLSMLTRHWNDIDEDGTGVGVEPAGSAAGSAAAASPEPGHGPFTEPMNFPPLPDSNQAALRMQAEQRVD